MYYHISAEFIIHLSEKHNTLETFKKVLLENGAEFSDSFVSNLLRIIQHMRPATSADSASSSKAIVPQDKLTMKFPGLAIANQTQKPLTDSESEGEEERKKKKEDDDVVADLMAQFEADAPSKEQPTTSDDKKRKRSCSEDRDFKKSDRSGSRDRNRDNRRRERSKSRDRSRDRCRRDSSKDRTRNRSRDCHRNRSRERQRDRSRDRLKRDRSGDKKQERYGDRKPVRSSDRKRERSGDRKMERSRDRGRDRSRERYRGRSEDKKMKRESPELEDDPVPGKIYSGKVANIVPFGCFVQLEGLRRRWEGLVHISQLRAEGRVTNVSEVVSRGNKVKVKVLSVTGQKVSLSMKDVCQMTGRDLNPLSHVPPEREDRDRNPDRPTNSGTSVFKLPLGVDDDNEDSRNRVTRISSPERWEIKQMISSGCIDKSELPEFDDETGLLPKDEDGEADIEIELVEEEPPFLHGHGRALHDLSPVR